MLTKKDIQSITEAVEQVVNKKIVTSLDEFFHDILAPYFDNHIEKKLDEHDKRFDEIGEKLDKSLRGLTQQGSINNNFEKRISALEKSTSFA